MDNKRLPLDGKIARLDSKGHLVISDPAVLAKLKKPGTRGGDAESVEVGVTVKI